MQTLTTTILTLSATLCCSSAFAAESVLAFVDLRAQGGVAQTEGQSGSLTLMAGDIGNKQQHIVNTEDYMGIVLGLRGTVSETTATREDTGADLDLKLGGGTIVGGFGFLAGKRGHIELVGGYGQGVGTLTGDTPWDSRDSRYKMYMGELGYYYTFDVGIQFGFLVGYSIVKIKYDDVGTKVNAKVDGFDAAIALGYRF